LPITFKTAKVLGVLSSLGEVSFVGDGLPGELSPSSLG